MTPEDNRTGSGRVRLLMLITALAVVSDAMLLPFYPRLFAERFGVFAPEHVGAYLAALCLTVMVCLPGWAWTARRCELLWLLIGTQLAAGLLCIACFFSATIPSFWVTSISMVAFKASYLLIYPYIMSQTPAARHTRVVGTLSIIVHFGGILGALLGGMAVQFYAPHYAFLVMAISDVLQILICMYLLTPAIRAGAPVTRKAAEQRAAPAVPTMVRRVVLLALVFYFSVYFIRPFFAEYWMRVSELDNALVSSLVYAIPAFMALLGLWHSAYRQGRGRPALRRVPLAVGCAMAGALAQGIPHEAAILLGRCLYGLVIFKLAVWIDVRLFEASSPDSYARDYSVLNFFQNLGVLASSYGAGLWVAGAGMSSLFMVTALGLAATLLLYPALRQKPIALAPAEEGST